MGLNAKTAGNGGMTAPTLEAGVYPARLVQLLDLGLQTQRPFQGQEKKPCVEIMLTYELTDEFMKDEDGEDILDKPRWVSETISLHNLNSERAKSTIRYKALDPTMKYEGDFTKLIGVACNVTIVLNPGKEGKVWENVGGVASMRAKDADKLPELVNPVKVFDLDEPDMEVYAKLPDWVQEKITSNLNFNGSSLQELLNCGVEEVAEEEADAGSEDEIPF
tara:strand:- start:9533 stop:10192 length:660 start_codon:yes stop_codon:yes gene_type:complete